MATLRELVTKLTFKVNLASFKAAETVTKKVEEALENMGKSAKDTEGKVNKIDKSLDEMGKSAKDTGRQLDKVDNSLDDMGNTAGKTNTQLGALLKGALGVAGIIGVADALMRAKDVFVQFTDESLNMFAEYERTLTTLGALTKTTGKDFDALKQKADELGATTKFTADETGKVMVDLARRGYSAVEILNLIDPILSTAIANNSDLATSMDAVTGAMKAYGAKASEAAHFSDVLTTALNSSNVNIEDFIEAMKNAAPAAKQGGQSIETLAILTGMLGEANIKGAEAGTKIRQSILRLVAPNKEQARVLAALGVKVADTTGKIRPMTDIIGELRTSFSRLTEQQKVQTAQLLVGDEALTGFTGLLGVSAEKQKALEDAQRNATGATKAQADAMSVGLKQAMEENESALDSLKTKWGELTSPAYEAWVKSLTGLFNGLTWAVDKTIGVMQRLKEQANISKVAVGGGVGFGIGASPYMPPSQGKAQGQASAGVPRAAGAGSKSLTANNSVTNNINISGGMTPTRARQLGQGFAQGSLNGFRSLEAFGL